MWLYKVTGEEKYNEKYKEIADAEYLPHDMKKFTGCTGPISWDDKRPGAYILSAIVTKDEGRMKEAYSYCDTIISQPTTPGGLWYDKGLSAWLLIDQLQMQLLLLRFLQIILQKTIQSVKAI